MAKSLILSLGAWNWFVLAVFLGLVEMLMPGLYIMWYALAAVLVGALALAIDMSWQIQLGLYAVMGFILLMIAMRFSRHPLGRSERPLLNRRGEIHIGKTYLLLEKPQNGRGRLKIGDGSWPVELEEGDGSQLEAGSAVLVTGIKGTTLIGKPAA